MHTKFSEKVSAVIFSEWGKLLGIAVLYYLVAYLGRFFVAQPESVATVWPVSGLGLSILLLRERKYWGQVIFVIFLTNLISNSTAGFSLPVSLGLSVTNCAESFLSAWMIRWLSRERIAFDRFRDLWALVSASVFTNALTGVFGAAVFTLGLGYSFWQTWLVWWVADGLGMILITPLVITWTSGEPFLHKPRRVYLESSLVLVGIMLVTIVIFSPFGNTNLPYLHSYTIFPLLIWSALRLPTRHVTLGLVILAILSVSQTVYMGGAREFIEAASHLRVLMLQLFLIVACFSTLALHLVVIERQRSEERLRESEERFSHMLTTSLDGVWIGNASRVTTFVNDRFCEMLGYTTDELVGQPLRDFILPEDRQVSDQQIDLRRQGDSTIYELRFCQKNGGIIWFRISATPVFEKNGEFAGSFGIFSNITERKQEEEVRAARLRLLEFAETHSLDELLQNTLDEAEKLSHSQIGFYHFVDDDQLSLTLQNWSTNTIKHMCTAEGKGKHYAINLAGVWVDCVHTRTPIIHNDYASLTHRKGLPEGHAPVIRELVVPVLRGEKIVAILGVGNKEQDYNDKDIEMVNMLADLGWEITERKRTQYALQQANEHMSATLDALPDLMFQVDHKYCITDYHTPFHETLYFAPEKFLGEDFRQLLPEPAAGLLAAAITESFETGFSRGTIYSLEIRGQLRWFEITAARRGKHDSAHTSSVALIRDITERKVAAEQLENALSDKEALLRELYHRTKNNMQVISAMLALQAENLTDEKATQIFQDVGSKIQSMAIVHQMLYRSQNLSSIDLKEYISALSDLLISTYRVRSHCNRVDILAESISASIDIAIPCGLMVNELITNALKYAFPAHHPGQLTVRLESRPDNNIFIEVSDNGIGFPPGYDVEQATTLGLQTVIALGQHQLQGKVNIFSGNGVTCQVEFPNNHAHT